jgi:hypothetical protein
MPSETEKGRQYAHIPTDGRGFLVSVSSVRAVHGLNSVVPSTEGAATTTTVELALASASRSTIADRSADRGVRLAYLVRDRTPATVISTVWEGMYRIPDGTDQLVNATPIGLYSATEALVPIDMKTVGSGMMFLMSFPTCPARDSFVMPKAREHRPGWSRNARKSRCYRHQARVAPIGSTVRREARIGGSLLFPSH